MAEAGQSARRGASIAGASIGTAIVVLAERLPTGLAPLRSTLIYAAPAIAVGLRFVWLWLVDWGTAILERWEVEKALKEARTVVASCHGNPASSQKHKEDLQSKLESLEKLRMELRDLYGARR